jgi:hypothetical protein
MAEERDVAGGMKYQPDYEMNRTGPQVIDPMPVYAKTNGGQTSL